MEYSEVAIPTEVSGSTGLSLGKSSLFYILRITEDVSMMVHCLCYVDKSGRRTVCIVSDGKSKGGIPKASN